MVKKVTFVGFKGGLPPRIRPGLETVLRCFLKAFLNFQGKSSIFQQLGFGNQSKFYILSKLISSVVGCGLSLKSGYGFV